MLDGTLTRVAHAAPGCQAKTAPRSRAVARCLSTFGRWGLAGRTTND